MKKAILVLLLASMVASCGVKSDLLKPNNQPTPANQNDPSRPPEPLGR
jgi:hypothetical protein